MKSPAISTRGVPTAQADAVPLISFRTGLEPAYPEPAEFFSPDEAYPEYSIPHLATVPNQVYRAVRDLFVQCGLDAPHLNTPDWNPLGAWVRPGDRVFILCNFVYHRSARESETRFQAKCTHGSVLRAVTDYALRASGAQGRVWFGNAPLQGCDWNAVLHDTGAGRLPSFYARHGRTVEARDLRMVVSRCDSFGRLVHQERRSQAGLAVEVDLGWRSRLAAITSQQARFRVTDYDPGETQACHSDGHHRYRVHRQMLEADVIISLPKLKTHEKVALTCGLKGFVGAIASKDCLAHHRFGGAEQGGDEYAESTAAARFASWLHEQAHRTWPRPGAEFLQILDRNLRRLMVRMGNLPAGAWHGNDTCWRMALDIGDILRHADQAGRWHEREIRRHLMLVDGIIGGQGNGPLTPDPAPSGILLFADDIPAGDRAVCHLIGFDPDQIPLVREAGPAPVAARVFANGSDARYEDLSAQLPLRFAAPRGWAGHVEEERSRI